MYFITITADIIPCKIWCRKFNKTSGCGIEFGPERKRLM